MTIDLHSMSLRELKELQVQVAKAISGFEERRKKEALAELEEKARALGFSLSELTAIAGVRRRASPAPKYRNPANPDETWTGRGRKPRWFDAALKSGKKPDDLAI